jgi:methylmalonyl-CoA mutase N-terminal domain/subunit
VETLTDQMEEAILAAMRLVEDAGGMYAAVAAGVVQKRIGESARAFQERVESGAQTVVGVNAYRVDESKDARPALPMPDPRKMHEHVVAFAAFKAARSREAVERALAALAGAANDPGANVFAEVVAAAEAGCTHGEICGTLRRELGFGDVLAIV